MTLKTTNALAAIQATLAAHFNEEAGPWNHDSVESSYQHIAHLAMTHSQLTDFIDLIARMKTDSEMDDGMSADDAIMTVNELIASARTIQRKVRIL